MAVLCAIVFVFVFVWGSYERSQRHEAESRAMYLHDRWKEETVVKASIEEKLKEINKRDREFLFQIYNRLKELKSALGTKAQVFDPNNLSFICSDVHSFIHEHHYMEYTRRENLRREIMEREQQCLGIYPRTSIDN